MKTFKDVYLQPSDRGIVDYINAVTESLHPPWERSFESEENAKYIGDVAFCFERKRDDTLPAARLTIVQKDSATWYIPNVVPAEAGELDFDQYNGLITEFCDEYLAPAANHLKMEMVISSGELSDEEIVGEEAARLLEIFSSAANKSTGSAHSLDRERWYAFIVASCRPGFSSVDIGNLERLLQQQGWSESQASKLAIQYEFAAGLISFMER